MDSSEWVFNFPVEIGCFQIRGNQYFVTGAQFLDEDPGDSHGSGELFELAVKQVHAYFKQQRRDFTLPLMTRGTDFRQRVWTELERIPAGQTCTYGEMAHLLNSSARAVGGACRHNPIALLVPCHRIVSAKGIGGYAGRVDGHNIDVKSWLLQHEA